MKSALIICHDFPPLNSVASHRPYSWYKNLNEFDIKPIVVCRKWKENIVSQEGKFQIDDQQVEAILNESKELHRVPASLSSRDKLILKFGMNEKVFERKIRSLIEQIKSLLYPARGEHYYLYGYCRAYLKENRPDVIVASGGPFDLFKYANKLSDEFNIPWIADYRDEWQGNISLSDINPWKRFLLTYLKGSEKRWTNNCSAFTSVSKPVIDRISKRINKKGYLVRNGLDISDLPPFQSSKSSRFTITYAGTIYNTTYVETFTKGLNMFIERDKPKNDEFNLQLIGIQLNLTAGTKRFLQLTKNQSAYISIVPSMTHSELMIELSKSDVFLNLVYGNIAMGMYAVKIFDYMALGRKIINVETVKPDLKHEFSEYMTDCYSPEEVYESLSNLFKLWKKGDLHAQELPKSKLKEFERKYQCEKFAEILKRTT